MDWLRLLASLALPTALGMLCVNSLLPRYNAGRLAVVIGYGALLGLLLVPLILRAVDALAQPLDFAIPTVVLASLLPVTLYAGHRLGWNRVDGSPGHCATGRALPVEKVLFLLLLSLILLRIVSVGLELWWRPLYPWDATMHWATKAKVWFESREIVPFVDNWQWLNLGGVGVYTDTHPDYPITVPLLQVWVCLALGHWNESLLNLPWLLCLLGLAGAFYGQARMAGSTALAAMTFTYFLLSLPLLDTHVALAGYADLFLGASYCLALMAFHNWTVTRQPGLAVLALVFALFCPLIKNEGFFWLLTFIPALAALVLSGFQLLMLFLLGLCMLAGVLLFFPPDLMVAGHSLDSLRISYRPDAVEGLVTGFWLQDNWHLLAYLLPFLVIPLAFTKSENRESLKVLGAALSCALALFLFLFLFTKFSAGAVRFTASGRISLHLMPALTFLCLLLWNHVSRRDCRQQFRYREVV